MVEQSKLDVYENWFIWQDMDFIIIKNFLQHDRLDAK